METTVYVWVEMRMYLFMAAIIVAVTPPFLVFYCIRIEYARTKNDLYTTHLLSNLRFSTYFAWRLAAVLVYKCSIGVRAKRVENKWNDERQRHQQQQK